jgi:hypothetical protein
LIGGSTPKAQGLGRHEDQLLPWHQELLKLGICDYSLEEARYELQLAALRTITARSKSLPGLPDIDVNLASPSLAPGPYVR